MTPKRLTTYFLTLALLLASVPAAGLDSNVGNVSLNAALAESLSVNVTSGSSLTFNIANNAISNAGTATISTSWNLNPGLTSDVKLYGYFDTPAAALTDGGGNDIASSKVEGRMTTGTPTTFTAFSQTNPLGPAGGSLLLFSEAITGANKIKTRSDNLELQINLTGVTLPAGSYVGTLRIQAQAL
jgi:hypothetical protein